MLFIYILGAFSLLWVVGRPVVDFGVFFGRFGSPLAALSGQPAPKGSILAYFHGAVGRGWARLGAASV